MVNAPKNLRIGVIWNFATKFPCDLFVALSLQSSNRVWTRIPSAY
jgi:hypothetical protein